MRARTTLSTARIPSTLAVVAILALCIAGCTRRGADGGHSSDAAAVPAPATPPSDDILAYIAIGSLDAAIERSADVARTLQPKDTERVTPQKLKAQLGAALQDPELKYLDTSKPIVLALLKGPGVGPIPPVVAILPAREGAPYAQMLSQMRMHTQTVGGLLAVAQSPAILASAAKVKALHDRVAGEKGMKLARVYLDAEGLLAAYGELLRSGVEQMTRNIETIRGAMGEEAVARSAGKILKLEFLAFHFILGQSDSLQLDLDWGKKGFDVDAVLAARAGTELAAFFSASASGQAPDRSLARSVGPMRGSVFIDPAAFDKLAGRLVQELGKDPAAAELITPDVASLVTSTKDYWKGRGTMSFDLSGKSLSVGYDMAIHSEEKLLDWMDRWGKVLAPGTVLGDFYKNMGLELAWSLQRNARDHAKAPVHRMEMTVNPLKTDGAVKARPELEAMKTFMDQKLELAVVGDRALVSGTPSDLDGMIDRALANDAGDSFLPASAQVFGKGRQIYFDYDIIGLFKAMASTNPDDPTAAMMRRLTRYPSAEPITYAVTFAEGRSLSQMRLPMDMIENLVKASQEAPEAGR